MRLRQLQLLRLRPLPSPAGKFIILTPSGAEATIDPCGTNKVCVQFSAIEPKMAANKVGSTIYLLGAGLSDNEDALVLTVNGAAIDKEEYSVTELNGQEFVEWVVATAAYEGSAAVVDVTLAKNDGTAEASPAQQIQFFEPTALQISPVSLMYPFVETSVQVSGAPVFSSGSPLCVFYILDAVVSFGTPEFSGTTYVCTISPDAVVGKSAAIYVTILLETPEFATSGYPDVDNYLRKDGFVDTGLTASYISLIAPAPVLMGASFSDNGASVVVSFDRGIQLVIASTYVDSDFMTLERQLDPIKCVDVFDSNFGLYGKFEDVSGECTITQSEESSIDINLSGEFANTDLLALAVDGI
jgi:hypothetical protein